MYISFLLFTQYDRIFSSYIQRQEYLKVMQIKMLCFLYTSKIVKCLQLICNHDSSFLFYRPSYVFPSSRQRSRRMLRTGEACFLSSVGRKQRTLGAGSMRTVIGRSTRTFLHASHADKRKR